MTTSDWLVGTTSSLSYNSSSQAIEAAINGLIIGEGMSVTGAGTASNPWVVAGQHLANVSGTSSQLTSISQTGPASWSSTFWTNDSGESFTRQVSTAGSPVSTTGTLAGNSTASQIQAALQALSITGASGFTVTGAGTEANPWVITNHTGESYTIFSSGSMTLNTPTGSTTASNYAGYGTYALTLGNTQGQSATTATLQYNSTPAQIQAALNALPISNANQLVVSGTSTFWSVTGPGLQSLTVADWALEGPLDINPVTLASPFYADASGGTFTMTLTNGASATTPALAYNSSATQIQTALQALPVEYASEVTVSGDGTSASPWVMSGSAYLGLSFG
ncbi:MAG: hypothetical protein ACK5F7_08175, partial [Planctomycetaceae bacterium]